MIVKVCGVTSPAIALAAVEAGADWIGLVFVPGSPRRVDSAGAGRVRDAVAGRADLIGVLVEPDAATCNRLAARHGLAAVQLHGDVAQDIVTGVDVPVIRALNLRSAHAAFTCTWWPDGLLMLDAAAPDGALPGGTGRRADEGVAAEVSRHRRIVLSGGLGPGNVAEAIGAVRPWGVDASSGLESAPGIKDPALIRRFVAAARSAAVAGGESR